ncbi:hypothetical protein [Clostridium sp. UBA5119]|uniref:hypothetical protein n=1 Tax=Clostridium sp. UBA5119 TaxID=1946366 RepID=UPI0032172791
MEHYLSLEQKKQKKDSVVNSINLLKKVYTNIIGAILNGVHTKINSYYYYYGDK